MRRRETLRKAATLHRPSICNEYIFRPFDRSHARPSLLRPILRHLLLFLGEMNFTGRLKYARTGKYGGGPSRQEGLSSYLAAHIGPSARSRREGGPLQRVASRWPFPGSKCRRVRHGALAESTIGLLGARWRTSPS